MAKIEPALKVGPITCGLCGKPVDRWEFHRDEAERALVMVAFCHGEKDRRTISDRAMSLSDAVEMEAALAKGGTAFDQTKLLEPK